MTKEEYIKKVKTAREICNCAIKEAGVEYAKANNPYVIGDIIEDHYHIIKIKSIKYVYATDWEYPSCVYVGDVLKKDLTLRKKQTYTVMYQINVKRKIEVMYRRKYRWN